MWTVRLHRLVLEEDFQDIDSGARKRILKAIQKKLTLNPNHYGQSLRGGLHGYWKLRVDDYRVVYRMEEGRLEVLVIQVGIRRDFEVYEAVLKRLRKGV